MADVLLFVINPQAIHLLIRIILSLKVFDPTFKSIKYSPTIATLYHTEIMLSF